MKMPRCNRCNSEIDKSDATQIFTTLTIHTKGGTKIRGHLCNDCTLKFSSWLSEVSK